MNRLCRVLLIVLLASNSALAADHEFRGLVTAIEDHYGVRHMRIPLLNFALFFVRFDGVSGLKVAVFEEFHPRADVVDDDPKDVVESSLGADWHLFVRERSRDDHENTLIYTRFCSGKIQMMVVTLEPGEATVVQMNLSDGAMKHWIREPGNHISPVNRHTQE